MPLPWINIQERALSFSRKWKDAEGESAEAQSFLNDFFEVFGIDRKRVATFEQRVPMGEDRSGYIDLLWKGIILIEMKSVGKSLEKAYSQAKDYAFHLEDEELPEYIMVSDFRNIRLERLSTGQVWNMKTSQLHKHVKKFAELAGYKASKDLPVSKEVDVDAAEKMAKLHDALKEYGYEGHALEVYLVRLLFCLFADDTNIFEKNIFFDYISNSNPNGLDLSVRIERLFEILNTPIEVREKLSLLPEELKRFAYIDGTLFEERLPIADFDSQMRSTLLECCAFDWGYISPAIFGAMFQGVMNPKERRALGAHYTSEENIMKVIKPLFLDELWEEFERVKGNSKQLEYFHGKISDLTFLDPACGCGNFLIIAYRELRKLELEILKMLIDTGGQMVMDIRDYLKVNVDQFYGIEIEEFPCQIAVVGMWLTDHQMNTLVSEHFGLYYARLPLKQSATIVHGNALRVDWNNFVSKNNLNYILGNPPFVGIRNTTPEQRSDMRFVFGENIRTGSLDYVTAWYAKTLNFIEETKIQAAFVSTNSIVQGDQAIILGDYLFKRNIHINFAHRTFKWKNEGRGVAAVYCVIIGFSKLSMPKKTIYIYEDISGKPTATSAENINQYLIDAPSVIIKKRSKPICDVPEMVKGCYPTDNGNYVFTEEEMQSFIKKEPVSQKYFRRWIGSSDLINNEKRFILFLKDCDPSELRKMPYVKERVEKVKQFRSQSKKESTRRKAETPTILDEERIPESEFLVVPVVSSENRKYIPVDYRQPPDICYASAFFIEEVTKYHLGVLMSKIHMAWMRLLSGRLKSDYRYSNTLIYNTFPWPETTEKERQEISRAAQQVLDTRQLYPESSLADLYDSLTMPPELTKAHNNLDKTVVAAYGGPGFKTEAERVADLVKRYQKLVTE